MVVLVAMIVMIQGIVVIVAMTVMIVDGAQITGIQAQQTGVQTGN